jgi:hypothetical protein
MTITKQVSLSGLEKCLQPYGYHQQLSYKEMLEYWCEKIVIRHFQFGNETRYGYPPLSPEYARRKIKKHGLQPQLVATGYLKDMVTTLYKVYHIGGKYRVVFKIPQYGKYVTEVRDFTIVNNRDKKDMLKFFNRDFANRRKRFLRSITIR